MNGWIGVDLDGTLAEYDHWRGADHIGKPIPAMARRVAGWLSEGREVRILTARVSGTPEERAAALRPIQIWCLRVFGMYLPVTCEKDYGMIELYDDRAVQVEMNTGKLIGYSTRGGA